MKQKNVGNESGIIEILKKLKKQEWIIIGGKKKWIRFCPEEDCDNIIFHNSKYSRNKCKKEENLCIECYPFSNKKPFKRKCHLCGIFVKHSSIQAKNKSEKEKTPCRKCYYISLKKNKTGLTEKERTRICPICKRFILHTKIQNRNKCEGKPCRKCYWKIFERDDVIPNGRETTKKTKEKISKSIIKLFKKRGSIYFNPKACEYFDKLNKENGWNLQHAKNGGEIYILGAKYKVDGYDKNRNIIVEYDEPHHYYIDGCLKYKDNKRMNEIINHLKCQFYRYNEKKKELLQYE